MIGTFGLLALLLLVMVGLGIVFALTRGRREGSQSGPPPAAGMTLNCPHCGQQTDAARSRCQKCGAEL